jgi:hypothetical protein
MIYRYDYKPSVEFITDKSEKIPKELFVNYNRDHRPTPTPYIPGFCTLGIEVEFERLKKFGPVDDAVMEISHLVSNANAYIKHDGSLENGYELVTQPRTLKSWFNSHKQFNQLFREMRKIGLRSYTGGRCGLHVHIGYQSFINDLHVMRFLKFVNGNPSFMLKLSGRTDPNWVQTYCRLSNPTEIAWYFMFKMIKPMTQKVCMTPTNVMPWTEWTTVGGRQGIGTHHSAVAITPSTVELRIFRGSLNTEKIYAIFEFIMALLSFTEYDRSINPKASNFIEFTKQYGKQSLLWSKLLSKIEYNGEEKTVPIAGNDVRFAKTKEQRIKSVLNMRNQTFGMCSRTKRRS